MSKDDAKANATAPRAGNAIRSWAKLWVVYNLVLFAEGVWIPRTRQIPSYEVTVMRRVNTGMLLIGMLLALSFSCVACTRFPTRSYETRTPPESAPTSTLAWFAPKVNLHDLRFVYAPNGRLYMDLSQPHDMLSDDLSASFPDLRGPAWAGLADANGTLPNAVQRDVLAAIPEERGDSYCVYYPDTHAIEVRAIESVGLRPTGDGWFSGVWAQLGGATSREPSEDFSYRPVGLAFRAKRLAHAQPLTPPLGEVRLDREQLVSLLRPVTDAIRDEIVDFEVIGRMYIRYPDDTMILVVVSGHREQWLLCLWHNGEALEPAMFYPWESPLEQIEGGDACGEPNDTELFVLPDLDGDGSNELLIWTTTSRLYAIREWATADGEGSYKKQYRLEEVSRTYFGP